MRFLAASLAALAGLHVAAADPTSDQPVSLVVEQGQSASVDRSLTLSAPTTPPNLLPPANARGKTSIVEAFVIRNLPTKFESESIRVATVPFRPTDNAPAANGKLDNDLHHVFGDVLPQLLGTTATTAVNESNKTRSDVSPGKVSRSNSTTSSSNSEAHTALIEFLAESSSNVVLDGSLEKPSNDAGTGARNAEQTLGIQNGGSQNRPAADQLSLPAGRSEPEPPTLTPRMESLRAMMQQVLAVYEQQYLNTSEHSCWSVMHLMLALGNGGHLYVGHQRGQVVRAFDWLCTNQVCAGRQLLYLENGMIRGREGPGYQGHPGQFLAMLAQINTPQSAPLLIAGRNFQVADLVESEKATCYDGIELTFKLISMAHYLDSDAKWTNDQGVEWDIPRLIAAELAQPINGAACGGTHRMMAISYAVLTRQQQGKGLTGQWWRAQKYMRDYHKYTMALQNPDGSFSSDWFRGRADWGGIDRKIQTTGHILEWLAFTLPKDELSDPRVVHSVELLTNLMATNRYHDWEVGPKCHAIRALEVYYQRAFGERSSQPIQMSSRPPAHNGGLSP
jgi:hypothetical protein